MAHLLSCDQLWSFKIKGWTAGRRMPKQPRIHELGLRIWNPETFFLIYHWGYHHFACQNHAILISGRSWSNVWVFGPRMIAFRMRSTWDISHMNSDILDVQRSPLHHHRIWWVHVMINGWLPGVINSDGSGKSWKIRKKKWRFSIWENHRLRWWFLITIPMCYPCGSYGKIMDSTEDFPASEGVGLETTSAVGETGPGSELELGNI